MPSDREAEESQQQLRVVLAMTTLLMSCVATAPCVYVLFNFSKFLFPTRSVFCTGVVIATDLAQCWLLLFFNIPTQLKGIWVFGFPACVTQGFLSRILKGGSHLALIILALQRGCCGCWVYERCRVMDHAKLFFFFAWTLVGSVSILPLVLNDVNYSFNHNLSHCDVGDYAFFIIHDVITYCVPVALLCPLSVRLMVCVCDQWNVDSNSLGRNHMRFYSHEFPRATPADDDFTGYMLMSTSQREGSATTTRSVGRSGLEVKWTLTVCILCTETAFITLVEWALRRWGCVLPSPSLTASSVLFACAGYIVRSTSIIIVERTYSSSSNLSTVTSSIFGDKETTTSLSHQRHHRRPDRSSWEVSKNRGRRPRHDRQGVKRSVGSRSAAYRRHSEALESFSSTVDDPPRKSSSGVTHMFSKRSSSSAASVCSTSILHGVRKRINRDSYLSMMRQDSQVWADGPRCCSRLSHDSQHGADQSRCSSRASKTNLGSYLPQTGTFSPSKDPESSTPKLLQRLPMNRRRSADKKSTQGKKNGSPSIASKKRARESSIPWRSSFLQIPLKKLSVARYYNEETESQGMTMNRKSASITSAASHGSGSLSRADIVASQADMSMTRARAKQESWRRKRQFSYPGLIHEKLSNQDENRRQTSSQYSRKGSFPSASMFDIPPSEGRFWDGRPDTLSSTWLSIPHPHLPGYPPRHDRKCDYT